jgi:hypothetical protein
LKLFAGNCWLLGKKSRLPLFSSVSVLSECAVSGVCSFNANELLPIAYKLVVAVCGLPELYLYNIPVLYL